MIVIGATAATTAVAGLLQFKQLAADISLTPALPHANVTLPNPGQPQTILIIGSDHRAGEPFKSANTDTMLLVRLNASSQTINVLSIPRDLEVDIPGVGTPRSTSAYSVGGPNLLIKMLRQQVFPGLQVNHIVDINFGGFEDLVNAIGCVYTDVDHRYYNNSAPGRPTTRASTSSPATRSCAARWRWSSCASATPTPTWSATRASRTSSAGPRTSTASTT